MNSHGRHFQLRSQAESASKAVMKNRVLEVSELAAPAADGGLWVTDGQLDQIHGGGRVIREAWREAAGTHQIPLCLVISTLTRFLPLSFSQVLLTSSTRNSARRTLWKASCKLNQSVAGRIQHRVQENQKSCSGEAHTRQIQ